MRRHNSIVVMSLISILATVTGCSHLPAVSAESAKYKSKHPLGETAAEAKGIRVTDARVEIDEYHRHSEWGWGGVTVITQDITVVKYSRDRKPGEDKKISTP